MKGKDHEQVNRRKTQAEHKGAPVITAPGRLRQEDLNTKKEKKSSQQTMERLRVRLKW
jgi:hypothetical protein